MLRSANCKPVNRNSEQSAALQQPSLPARPHCTAGKHLEKLKKCTEPADLASPDLTCIHVHLRNRCASLLSQSVVIGDAPVEAGPLRHRPGCGQRRTGVAQSPSQSWAGSLRTHQVSWTSPIS